MTDKDRDVEVIDRHTAYQGYYRLDAYQLRHSLFQGGMGPVIEREVFGRGEAVMVLPYDPSRDEIVLIEQFRIGPFARGDDPWSLEVVAGGVEAGESLVAVARREAFEEAGIELHDITPIMGCYMSPGSSSEHISIYYARTDASTAGGVHGLAAEGENIRVIVLPFAAVLEALDAGKINAAPVVVAIQWLALHRTEVRRRWGF